KELNSHDQARIFKAMTFGSSPLAIVSQFGYMRQTVYCTIKRASELNHFGFRPRTGGLKKLNWQIIHCLLCLVRSFRNVYFCNLVKESGANVCINTICCTLRSNLHCKWRRCKRIQQQRKDVEERLQ
ncbi:hypothetical protein C7212DRAFT_60364, partial [Tuber magnatum]